MPGPVRAFAEHPRVTAIVNTIRDLFTGQLIGTDIWIAMPWCIGILIVAYCFAMVIYHRKDLLAARRVGVGAWGGTSPTPNGWP